MTSLAAPSPVPARSWFKASQRILGRDWPTAYLFVLGIVLLLGGIKAYPFLRAVWLSFHYAIGPRVGAFVGLENYVALWNDDRFVRAVGVTLTFTFFSVLFKFVLGLSTALLLHNLPRWGAVLGGLILLPSVVPDVVRALAWRMILDPLFGAGNYLLVNVLHVMSSGVAWLGDPRTALPSVIFVNVWAGTPFFVILLLAGLKSIEGELYDAASVDGANAWRRFLHVTLPGLRYVIVVATLLATIFTFNGFTLTYLLTGGGPNGATRVYPILAYTYAVSALRYSAGVAVAMTAVPFLILPIVVLGRYMMRRDDALGGGEEEGRAWRAAMLVLWPVRMLTRGLVTLFWSMNATVERLASAIGRMAGPASAPLPKATRRRLGASLMYLLVGGVLLFELLPYYFVIVTAFKSELQIQRVQSMFWPTPWVLDHFVHLFTQIRFVDWYRNTVVVAFSSTAISVLVASLGAYGLVRLRWRGARALGTTVLIAYLMPGALMFIPMYLILAQIGAINSLWALLLTYPSFVLPFATWLMMGYYRSIPEELEDAAMIDGCNRLQAFWWVVLPLARPAVLAVALLSITQAWNEFLYAYAFIWDARYYTLPVGLNQLIVGDIQPWGLLMAASLLTALPVVIIYMLGQRFMVAGLAAGSVKG